MHFFLTHLKFEWLPVFGASNEFTSHLVARADLGVRNLLEVGDVSRYNNLERSLAAAIIELNKEKVLATKTSGASPATYCNNQV